MYLKALEEKGISNFMVSYFFYNSTNVQLDLYFQYYHFSFFDAISSSLANFQLRVSISVKHLTWVYYSKARQLCCLCVN